MGKVCLHLFLEFDCICAAWINAIIPHPKDKNRVIFKYHDEKKSGAWIRFFYDRPVGSIQLMPRTKKLLVYIVTCGGTLRFML
jgi:hypothetical protein